ncbi:hypothetical protein FACS189427_07360 [Planctomycetales bacterium]|nr:hypothetical protein FACS189427_07360 [Planctomycetales bacterium]
MDNKQMTGRKLEFAVFCIEGVAERLKISGQDAYSVLTQSSDILDNYIIANYDVLHTQGKEYIVDDIIECMRNSAVTD